VRRGGRDEQDFGYLLPIESIDEEREHFTLTLPPRIHIEAVIGRLTQLHHHAPQEAP
jgi:hypothetical protein